MINLYESLISHTFIDQLPTTTPYTICTDGQKWKNTNHVTWYSFVELLEDQKKSIFISGKLICISYSITIQDIVLIDNLLQYPCTRINCNPWVMSIIKKSLPEENDILPMIERWYIVKEPINEYDLITSLQPKSYLRIFDMPIAQKLSTLSRDTGIWYISWSQSQSHFTVLSTVSCSDAVGGALTQCSKWSDNIFEFFIRSSISIHLSQEIIASIQRTQHIILIIDHKATEELWLFCDTLIKQHCGKNITIQYIFPQFHLVSSILEDYIHEESQFDQPSLEAYISESIESYN